MARRAVVFGWANFLISDAHRADGGPVYGCPVQDWFFLTGGAVAGADFIYFTIVWFGVGVFACNAIGR